MSELARWCARQTWFYILVWMRKPWMRRLQLGPARWMKPERRERFIQSHIRQNRIARKIGLKLLLVSYTALFASLALQVAYQSIMFANEQGWLSPSSLEDRQIGEPNSIPEAR